MTGAGTGTLGGGTTISGLNKAALNTKLDAYALSLQTYLQANAADADVENRRGNQTTLYAPTSASAQCPARRVLLVSLCDDTALGHQ